MQIHIKINRIPRPATKPRKSVIERIGDVIYDDAPRAVENLGDVVYDKIPNAIENFAGRLLGRK